jgi:hypothetical protein
VSISLEDLISIKARKYAGKGEIKFDNSEPFECDFEFTFRDDGKSKFEVVSYVTNDNCNTILDLLLNEKIHYASFEGIHAKNGKIKIDKLANDGGNIDGSSLNISQREKYLIREDLLRKILSLNGADEYLEQFRNTVFTSRLRFLVMSQVVIDYEKCRDSDIITSVSSLSNFQFGSSEDNSSSMTSKIEEFSVNIDKVDIQFETKPDYPKIISQCSFNRNPYVTSTATMDLENEKTDSAINLLNKICMLLSFSNGNWIIPLYTDYFKKGTLIRIIFYKNKTYRFNKSRYLIDSKNSPFVSLEDFLTRSYIKYDSLTKDFRIHKVIEYYISALVNSIEQEKFAVGYIALEVLCNAVPAYARNKGEVIEIKAIEETRGKLKKVFEKLKLDIGNVQLEHITDEIAYKKVTIKDAQRYLLKDLSLEIDETLIKELYDIRNKLYHGADYESNYKELSEGTVKLFDLLDRLILNIFGLKGINYLSKVLNYKEKKL